MLTTANTRATRATSTRTQGAMLTLVKNVKRPAMNSAQTSAVTKMKTKPMITVLRREPVRSVSASSTESTHSEQGLKPSTSAISAVVTTSDCLPASTSPNTGSVMTSEAAFEPSSVGAAGDVGSNAASD